VRAAVMLVLLFGLTHLTSGVAASVLSDGRLAVLVGFLLLTASLAGTIAAAMGLPRLTGFILVGIAAGPSVSGLLPSAAVGDLKLIDDFALALIAMLAGGELQTQQLRPHARTILWTTFGVTGIVWVGMVLAVFAVRPVVPFLADLPWTGALGVALLLGVWSANSSPDLTVAVIEERHAKGTLVEILLGVTIVKDVVVILLFTLTLVLAAPLLRPGEGLSLDSFVLLAREVGGALVVGSALGWVFSQYLGGASTRPRSPMATFLFAYVLVVVAAGLHIELLLTGVAAGFVIENLSPAGDRMIQGIRAVAVVIFAFFFAVAGASLDLGAVGRYGFAALVLFSARVALTRYSARLAMRRAGTEASIVRLGWQGLISQGGVSLGLILVADQRFPEIGPELVALAMSIIIGNILGGPILLGRALAAGERGEG